MNMCYCVNVSCGMYSNERVIVLMCPVDCIAMSVCYCVNVSCGLYSNEHVLLCQCVLWNV